MPSATLSLRIGGIDTVLHGGDDLAIASRLPGMLTFRSATPAADPIHIGLDSGLTPADCTWVHRFELTATGTDCRFGLDAEGVYHYDFGGSGWLRFDPRRPELVEISPLRDTTLLRFALWVAYSMAGLWRGAVPVHSSTVVCRGRALLCLGESGTGKSTHTRLWLNHIADTYLLNDDSPIVRVEGGETVVYGSPWSGKAPCFRPERVPVAALVRLEQRPENRIRRLGTVEALLALQPSCPPSLAKEEHTMDRLLDFVGSVIERTPVYRLGCLPDADAARLCHNTVFNCQS